MTFKELFKKYKEECDSLICEPPAYLYQKSQGEYTIEDFDNMPETRWMELIDGEFVYVDSATILHQSTATELLFELRNFVKSQGGKCMVIGGPGVLPNPKDHKTELIPDVVVLCDLKKATPKYILGGPDLVIEILSSSTRHRDLGVKKKKYQDGGVREYWTVDLEKECVLVNDFELGQQVRLYSFDDIVPVGIFNNECAVDFHKILKQITLSAPNEGDN